MSRRLFLKAIVLSTAASCARQQNLVRYPCGGQRPAAEARPQELTPLPGEIVGVVDMPWSGDAYVDLDTPQQSAKTDAHGQFVFRGVEPGRHLIRTRALGYQPQQDSVVVPAQGAVVRIQPRTLAVCLL